MEKASRLGSSSVQLRDTTKTEVSLRFRRSVDPSRMAGVDLAALDDPAAAAAHFAFVAAMDRTAWVRGIVGRGPLAHAAS